MTAQERETFNRIHPMPGPMTTSPVSRPYEGSIAMLPVVQLYVRDVPGLRAPAGADLLHVLWCPFDHPPECLPRTALFWRSAAAVTDVMNTPPEPPAVQYEGYALEPCRIDPEQVTEYPAPLELGEDLREQLEERDRRLKRPDSDSDWNEAEAVYQYNLSVAPGWKIGGWAPWSFRDPTTLHCRACGTRMEPLLTIATCEWDAGNHSWIPYEDRAAVSSADYSLPELSSPTSVLIGRGYNQQLYVCPARPEHPHAEWMQ